MPGTLLMLRIGIAAVAAAAGIGGRGIAFVGAAAAGAAGAAAAAEMGDRPEDEPGTGGGDDDVNDDVDHEMALLSGAEPQQQAGMVDTKDNGIGERGQPKQL